MLRRRQKSFLIFAAILGFALGGSFVWGLSYETPNEKGHPQWGQNSYNSQGISEYVAVAQPKCDPNCATKETNENSDKGWTARFVRKSLDDPLAVFTGVLALATMVLAIYTAVVA